MTGTSLDAVDMAVLETDGEAISRFGPAGERALTEATRDIMIRATRVALAWPRGTAQPAIFAEAARAGAEEHFAAAEEFLAANGLGWPDIDLIGMHGQTVLHERPQPGRIGRTVQLSDAEWLAGRTGVAVAYDFRSADVAAGGEGAPLAPIYHLARARASGLETPLAVLNIGGVANVTLCAGGEDISAFDTGPGNGMIDLLVQGREFRPDLVSVDASVLAALLSHPYFAEAAPKSLDRFDFPLTPLEGLSIEDAAATLVAFTAEGVRLAFDLKGQAPREVVVCGGGRRNPQIMQALAERLPCPVRDADALGWRGDAIEAEAFAYLAARTLKGLPISFPGTTGAPEPLTGGRIAEPA